MFMSYNVLTLVIRFVCVFCLTILLSACQLFPSKQQAEAPIPEMIQPPVVAVQVVTEQQKHIASLLSEADYALSQNKLLDHKAYITINMEDMQEILDWK